MILYVNYHVIEFIEYTNS